MVPLNIWFKECKNLKLGRKARVLRWVEQDDDFKPAQLDLRFKQLTKKGITSYCVISTKTGLESFLHLQESHKLDRQDLYRYLQIRHHFERNIKIDDEADLDLINVFIDAYRGIIRKKLVSK